MVQKALLQASGDGTAVPAGVVGTELVFNGSATATTAAATEIGFLGLPIGVWLVNASVFLNDAAGSTGANVYMQIKGSASYTVADTQLGYLGASGQLTTVTFPIRTVTVQTAGEATETIKIRVQAIGANRTALISIHAVRIA
jgi:hypothetical protein